MTTRAEVLKLVGCELDAAVAERVMGWLVVVSDDGEDWYERQVTRWPCLIQHREGGQWLSRHDRVGMSGHDENWSPSSDSAADLSVHRAACRWAFSRRQAYFRAIDAVIQRRVHNLGLGLENKVAWPDALAFYEVGDFSKAALLSLSEEG